MTGPIDDRADLGDRLARVAEMMREKSYPGDDADLNAAGDGLHPTVAGTPVDPRIGCRPNSPIGFDSLADVEGR